ncbi:uncharacterized protein LOC131427026 [Malaya genurostris]|uniref:uncharacterized protein LOC131427026 n=1 Tax=Malaya genurostris TaxID=325434 RepID=UPI0026F3A061|nr:uncharacterized protein LOC131427026 [Malaya genurostris]
MQTDSIRNLPCPRDDFWCRLCLSSTDSDHQQLFPLGVSCTANERLSRIYDCLEIHVSFLEDFCSVICRECREKIDSFYTFKKQCQSNDSYVRRKRSNIGADFERMQCLPDFDRKEDCHEHTVEPDNETLVNQTRDVFFPDKKETIAVAVQDVPECLDKEVQTCDESTSETFCGFPLESYARRSPRIFIKRSVKEAFERQKPALAKQKEGCHISLEMLDIKPNVFNTEKSEKTLEPQQPKLLINPMSTKRKATIYFEGFQYSRPKLSHNGNTVWSCCLVYCPARLEKDTRGAISVHQELHRHRPQVLREGTIFNGKNRRAMQYVLVKTNGRQCFIYNDAYRYRFEQKVSNTKSVWSCEEDGCKSYVNIFGDFQRVSCIYKHNHREEKIVFRKDNKNSKKRKASSIADPCNNLSIFPN